jgi:hypothetical protein
MIVSVNSRASQNVSIFGPCESVQHGGRIRAGRSIVGQDLYGTTLLNRRPGTRVKATKYGLLVRTDAGRGDSAAQFRPWTGIRERSDLRRGRVGNGQHRRPASERRPFGAWRFDFGDHHPPLRSGQQSLQARLTF